MVGWMAREWSQFSLTQKAFESFKAAHCDFKMSVFFSTQLSEVTGKLRNPAECTAALAHSDVHTSWGQITAGKRVQFRVKPELVVACAALWGRSSPWKMVASHANRKVWRWWVRCQRGAGRFCFMVPWSVPVPCLSGFYRWFPPRVQNHEHQTY